MKTAKHWEKIGFYPHHGIAVPLFSLRSQKSGGIGEFLDLLPLIDWCQSIGFDTIQLLPLNDTGDDPSPYNPLSSTALDPIYLSLSELPQAPALDLSSLNALPRLAHAEVRRQKLTWLYRYFQKAFREISSSEKYRQFLHTHRSWLPEYTLFKAIKEAHGNQPWKQWPASLQSYAAAHTKPWQEAIDFHAFLQYHCFSQLEQARAYATQKKVFLKGDLSILVSPDSADVWAHPHLFRCDLSAGAPPDYYNPQGQHWGFPLFDWEAMKQDGYAWWKRRLAVIGHLFHMYRIDHVVGFFRIWGIPEGKQASEGHYIPVNPSLWPQQGREILEMMIDASPLLPLAEDLGTIPPEVYPILRELGICGTKMIRWQRKEERYIPFHEYEPFSITTVSTPDSETLQMWWKKFPDEAIPLAESKGWAYRPDLSTEYRLAMLRDAHHTSSYFHINLLQEYLALFPDELAWPNPEEERINIPGTLLPTNWTYRFRPALEELLAHRPLSEIMTSLAKN